MSDSLWIPCISSKENEGNTGQAMVINGTLPLGGEQGDPTVRSVAALLTYKLKNGETPPDNGHHHQPKSCGACSFCHGDGAVVLDVPESDPDYADIDRASGKAIPCPYCG